MQEFFVGRVGVSEAGMWRWNIPLIQRYLRRSSAYDWSTTSILSNEDELYSIVPLIFIWPCNLYLLLSKHLTILTIWGIILLRPFFIPTIPNFVNHHRKFHFFHGYWPNPLQEKLAY